MIRVQSEMMATGYFHKVWFVRNGPDGGLFVRRCVGPGMWEDVEVAPGEKFTEPTLVLPDMEARELVNQLTPGLSPDAGAVALAKDAIGTRDRLLSLVERLAVSNAA